MIDFNAILAEGLFYEKERSVFIEQDGGVHVALTGDLGPVVGQHVQFALHHLPPNGIEPGVPGLGSCRYPGGVGCPVQHNQYPDLLLSFHMQGVLRNDPWRVEKFDGSVVPVPVAGMPGHFGRVGVATVVDVEKMREVLAGINPENLAASGINVRDLEGLLARLREVGKGR